MEDSDTIYTHLKLIEDPSCSCSSRSVQDIHHILVECPLLDVNRSPLIQEIEMQSDSWPLTQLYQLLHTSYIKQFLKFVNSINFDKSVL
ncbi:hypothetical protein O3M35_007622 [Rhynocoris fuscipes]|uniref:Uncharacterized protein n=1 Tax=Rhynocoris fuscipes TaxID=488301 RepID=A0AAW1DCM9_9HEMI